MSADYTRNVSSSSSNNMHHVSSSSNKGGRPVSILPNMSLQNMSNWSNLVNMNMANMANLTYPMMRPSVMVKQRKTNFTQREVDALIGAVRQHQDTVLFGVAGGPGWAKAWTQVAAAVSAVEGIVRSEGDVRKKWTYLKWEAKNTSKPDRDSTSRAVLQILTNRQNQIDAANQATLRGEGGSGSRQDSLRDAVQSSRSLLEELLVPPQPGTNSLDATPSPQPSASVGRPPVGIAPKQVDIKREQLSPRERPSPQHGLQQSSMATPPAHQPTPPSYPQVPPPRRSAPPQMRPPSPVHQSQHTQPPAPPPEVCLRWNSYHSNMQATFPSLLNNEQFVDVTLACEGHSIKCHKVMLSACSSYFEELLSQNPCQHPIVLMKDLRFWEVQALVDFMYRGEVNVTQDKLPSLLAAAEALQIKGLAGPASNSTESESSRGAYEDLDPSHPLHPLNRRRKRRVPVPDPTTMVPIRNPVGRPRIHPKAPAIASRPPVAVAPAANMVPRIQVRPDHQLQRSSTHEDVPPARRIKLSSPPASPAVKMEPSETDLSNDSVDKMRYMDRDGGESGGSGDGSLHGELLVDLSHDTAERYRINNGLKSDRNREHSDDQDNDQDDDRAGEEDDDDDDRGPDNDRDSSRQDPDDSEGGRLQIADLDQDDDQDMENDNDRENDNDHDLGSDDERDLHSSDEDQYDHTSQQDSRQQQADNLADHLLGRL